jgi:hypothetical protein
VDNVLEGVEGLTSVTDAAAILADVEAVELVAEPLDGVLAAVGMILGAMIYGHFRPRRHLMTADQCRRARARAFQVWQQETCVQIEA